MNPLWQLTGIFWHTLVTAAEVKFLAVASFCWTPSPRTLPKKFPEGKLSCCGVVHHMNSIQKRHVWEH